MLQKMHEHIKGWVATVVLVAVCLAFLFFGIEYYVGNSGSGGGKVAAKVNGDKITTDQVNKQFRRLQRQYSAAGHALTEDVNAQLKDMALQQLIAQRALTKAAKDYGFIASKTQVDNLIMSTPLFQEKGVFSPQRFKQFLFSSGLTENQFVQQLSQEMMINQIANSLASTAFVLPGELESYYDALYQRRSFSYLLLQGADFAKQVTVGDKEIQAYYQNHKEDFRVPEKVSIQYLQLSPLSVSQSVKVEDAQLKQYYEDNIGNYRRPIIWKVERVFIPIPANATPKQIETVKGKVRNWVVSLKKGEKFSDLMKEQEGITQELSENQIAGPLAQALKSLKPSQVSAPIQTKEGYSIVRLLSVQPASTLPFEKVKLQIKKMLVEQKTQALMSQLNDKLSQLTYMNPGSLEPAAKALKVKLQTTPLFTKQGDKKGLIADPKVIAVVFSDDVLKQGNNSNPVVLKDGSVVVLRVKERKPSHIPPLSDLKDKIKEQLTNKLAQAKAALLANTIQAELQKGGSADDVLQQHNLTWKKNSDIARKDKTVKPLLLTAVFSKLSMEKGHKIATVALTDGDVAVVKLDAVNKPDFAKVSAGKKQALKIKLQQYAGRLEYQLYVHSVKQNTKIKQFSK